MIEYLKYISLLVFVIWNYGDDTWYALRNWEKPFLCLNAIAYSGSILGTMTLALERYLCFYPNSSSFTLSKVPTKYIFGCIFIASCLMMIPRALQVTEYAPKETRFFYLVVWALLPLLTLPFLTFRIYQKVKDLEKDHIDNPDINTTETIKEAKFDAKLCMGIVALMLTSLIIYILQFVSFYLCR